MLAYASPIIIIIECGELPQQVQQYVSYNIMQHCCAHLHGNAAVTVTAFQSQLQQGRLQGSCDSLSVEVACTKLVQVK